MLFRIAVIVVLLTLAVGAQGLPGLTEAQDHYDAGEVSAAQELLEKTLPSSEGLERVQVLTLLGTIELELEQFETALSHLQEATKLSLVLTKTRKMETESVLADALYANGATESALESYRRVVELSKEQATSFDQATALWNLADTLYELDHVEESTERAADAYLLYLDSGAPAEALKVVEDMAARLIASRGPDDSLVLVTHNVRTNLLGQLGRFEDAVKLGRETVEQIRAQRPDSEILATAISNLGGNLSSIGAYQEAISKGEEAVRIIAKVQGDVKATEASCLSNLAISLTEAGRFREAREVTEKALKLRRQLHEFDHPMVALMENNLGQLLFTLGDHDAAEIHLKNATESLKNAGPKYQDKYATALDNLSEVPFENGDWEEVIRLRELAAEIRKECVPPEHPSSALGLSRLAQAYEAAGDTSRALTAYERAHQLIVGAFGDAHPHTAVSLAQMSALQQRLKHTEAARVLLRQALEIDQKSLPSRHSQTRTHLAQLAELELANGNAQLALELGRSAERIRRAEFQHVLTFTSDYERVAFYKNLRPHDLYCQLGSAEDILENILVYKAAVVDSVVADLHKARESDDPKIQSVFLNLRAARKRLSTLIGPGKSFELVVREFDHVEALERQLAELTAGTSPINYDTLTGDVQGKLAVQEALVEFIEFSGPEGEPQIGAVILAASGQPAWVPLGDSKGLKRAISKVKRAVRRGASDARYIPLAQELRQRLWAPLEEHLPQPTSRVFLAPDGVLNFVSFAALVEPDGRFLGETLSLSYLVSGRDLLLPPREADGRGIALFGGANFQDRQVAGKHFDQLPFSEVECRTLAELARTKDWSVAQFQGRDASETNLYAAESWRVLHIATHGHFQRGGLGVTGLVLSLSEQHDGFASALEVASMDLSQTELVVLSACDTGLGELAGGEVRGLRRAFRQAGASQLLMTLWPISDETTAEYMADFYQQLFNGARPPEALFQVQSRWLEKLRKERGAATAAKLIAPFVLSR